MSCLCFNDHGPSHFFAPFLDKTMSTSCARVQFLGLGALWSFLDSAVWRPSQRSCAWRESPWIPWCWESQLSAVAERNDFSSRYQSLMFQALLMANFPMVSLKISAVFEGQWKAIESTHTVNPGPLWPPWLNRSPSRSQTSKMEMASNLPRGFKLFLTWGSWSSSSSCIIQFHELQAVTAKVSRWKGKWNLGSSRHISLGSYAVVLVRSRLGSLYRLWCTRSHLRESSQWTPSRLCSRDFWTVSLATRQRWT